MTTLQLVMSGCSTEQRVVNGWKKSERDTAVLNKPHHRASCSTRNEGQRNLELRDFWTADVV